MNVQDVCFECLELLEIWKIYLQGSHVTFLEIDVAENLFLSDSAEGIYRTIKKIKVNPSSKMVRQLNGRTIKDVHEIEKLKS